MQKVIPYSVHLPEEPLLVVTSKHNSIDNKPAPETPFDLLSTCGQHLQLHSGGQAWQYWDVGKDVLKEEAGIVLCSLLLGQSSP